MTCEEVPELKGQKKGATSISCAFSVLSTPETVLSYLDVLLVTALLIGLDIETYVPGCTTKPHRLAKGETRKGTPLEWQAARIRLISLSVPGHDALNAVVDLGLDIDAKPDMRHAVLLLLARLQDSCIIGHHLGFDLCFLEHEFGWRPLRIWDTWVAAELLHNDDEELVSKALLPKSLEQGPNALVSVAKKYLGHAPDKELGGGALSNWGAAELGVDQYAYSAADAVCVAKLQAPLAQAITLAGLDAVADIEMRLVPILSHAELVGIPMQAELLDAELGAAPKRLAEIDARIEAAMRASGFDPSLDYRPKSKTYLEHPKKAKPTICRRQARCGRLLPKMTVGFYSKATLAR
jgi:3'-5' exonuclease